MENVNNCLHYRSTPNTPEVGGMKKKWNFKQLRRRKFT